jgi:hypothetical protein
MKIALLMSGQMRTIDVCAEPLNRFVIAPLQQHADVRLYCHAASDADAHKAYEFLPPGSKITIEDQPILDEKNYVLRSGKGVCGIQSVLRQFWSWHRVWSMAERDEFDFAVRIRSDTLHYNAIETPDRWKRHTLYVPRFSSFWGVCDRFAFGDREVMRRWHCTIDRLDEFMRDGAAFHPESLVLRSVGADVPVARTDALFSTVRGGGELRTPQFVRDIGDAPVA